MNPVYCRASSIALASLIAAQWAMPAEARARHYDIPSQPMPGALRTFGLQSGRSLVYASANVTGLVSPGVSGQREEGDALREILGDNGLISAPVRGGYVVKPMAARSTVRFADAGQPPVALPADGQGAVSNETDGSEIIVTAERRSQRLEEVPAAVSVVSGEAIARSGVVKFMDFAQLTSGVQMQKNGYTTQPSVRGISSLTTGYGFENNTALYIDGFYQPDSVAINSDLTNIDQVEILKGPQGSLYGRNATAGAILVNTREPSSTFGGEGKISYARFDDRLLQGYVTGPLAEGVAFSLAGSYRRSDGYIRDLGDDGRGLNGFDAVPTKNDSLRAKLLVQPANWAKITLGYNYGKVLDAVGLAYTVYAFSPAARPQPPLRATERDTVTNNGRPDNTAILNEGTIKAEITTGIGTLTTHTSYGERKTLVKYDFDASKVDTTRGIIPARQDTFQHAVDFSIDAIDNLDLLVGAHYFNDDIHINGQQAVTGGVVTTTDYVRLQAHAYAGYLDATYHLGALSITAGARYSHERKRVSYRQFAANPVSDADKSATFSKVTPRVVVKYEVAPRTNVYASFSTGFRSGVFQNQVLPVPAAVQPIQPEEITAWEVGLKTVTSGIRFDAAAFYYDYSNLHVGVVIPNTITGSGVISTIINAKAAEVYGGEASISLSPITDLNLSGGVTVLHARYTDFKNATGTGFNATTGLNVSNQSQDWSDHQMARAPTVSATFQAHYAFGLLSGRAGLGVNASYTSSYVVNNPALYGPLAAPGLANQQRYRQGAYGLVNAQASWTDPNDHYTVTLFVNNLTNTRYQLVTSGGSFGDYRQYNQPVSVGGSLGLRF